MAYPMAVSNPRGIRLSGKPHADVAVNKGSEAARAAVAAVLAAVKKDLDPKQSGASDLLAAAKRVVAIDADKDVESKSLRLTFKTHQQLLKRHMDDFGAKYSHAHDIEAIKDAKRHVGRSASAFLSQPEGRKAGARMTFTNAASAVSATRAAYGDLYREPKRVGKFCSRGNRARCNPAAAPSSTRSLEPKIHQMTKPGAAHMRHVMQVRR